jgi:hypothetical protein
MPKFNVKPDPFYILLKSLSFGQFETVYMVISFTQLICDPRIHASSEHIFVDFPRKFCEMFRFSDNQCVPEWASFELEPFVATYLICTDIVSRCLKGL